LIAWIEKKNADGIIRSNFDANLEESEWQYDYIGNTTTEVLAEGNLHRSNVIRNINYDVPEYMQRIGRKSYWTSIKQTLFIILSKRSRKQSNSIRTNCYS
jgi:hypothetical protein